MALAFIAGALLGGVTCFFVGIAVERDRHVCSIERADISEALRRSAR